MNANMKIDEQILIKHNQLSSHPMYRSLTTIDNVRTFMKYHVFAVWDFMSLLKALQKEITCTDIPWTISKYDPELVRLINEIVIAEESDIDQQGRATSHFSLYIKAMEEIGADTSLIHNFLQDYNFNKVPNEIKEMLAFHLNLAQNGKVHEIASSFFYGREKLIPEMFTAITNVLKQSRLECPNLIYYLDRHIELDGDEHGPKALVFLNELLTTSKQKQQAVDIAKASLNMRWKLWDFIQGQMAV